MPRPPSISYPQFSQAAREVLASGERLTLDRVRAALGGRGGTDVLRRYLDQFLAERLAETSISAVPPSLQALYRQALEEARAEAQADLASDARQLQAERDALAREREEFQQRTFRAEALAQANAERADGLQREREQLHARVDAEREHAEDLARRLAAAEAALGRAREACSEAVSAAQAERKQLVEHFLASLERATQRFEGLQLHTLRLVDDLRTQHVAAIDARLERALAVVQRCAEVSAEGVRHLPERVTSTPELDRRLRDLEGWLQAGVDGATARFGRQMAGRLGDVLDAKRRRALGTGRKARARPSRG